jgi:hypothetical protein
MVRGRLRTWALLGAAAALIASGGCTGDSSDDRKPPQSPTEEDIAAATNTYLRGDGAMLLRFHRDAAELPETLDGAALDDRCTQVRERLGERYPAEGLMNRLQRLPDPRAGRLWTVELDAMLSTVDSCADGDRDKARRAAGLTATVARDLESRLDKLRKVGEKR